MSPSTQGASGVPRPAVGSASPGVTSLAVWGGGAGRGQGGYRAGVANKAVAAAGAADIPATGVVVLPAVDPWAMAAAAGGVGVGAVTRALVSQPGGASQAQVKRSSVLGHENERDPGREREGEGLEKRALGRVGAREGAHKSHKAGGGQDTARSLVAGACERSLLKKNQYGTRSPANSRPVFRPMARLRVVQQRIGQWRRSVRRLRPKRRTHTKTESMTDTKSKTNNERDGNKRKRVRYMWPVLFLSLHLLWAIRTSADRPPKSPLCGRNKRSAALLHRPAAHTHRAEMRWRRIKRRRFPRH